MKLSDLLKMGGLSFNEEVKFNFEVNTGSIADLDKAYGKIATS